jgi:SSS family solute:Na+ symporter
LFFFTVSFGVLSTLVIPDLSAKASDRIWPLVVARLNGPILSPILLLAPIAALMTTMDSQLLTLSSIVVRDLVGYRSESSIPARLAVILLTLAGTAIALSPPSDIIAFLNRTSFSGYAALAPVVYCGFYGMRTGSVTALAGMLAGEAMVVALGFGWVSFPGIPDIFPVAGTGWTIFGIGSVFRSSKGSKEPRFTASRLVQTLPPLWILAFLLVLVPVMDFWNWNREPVLVFGLPDWVWRSIASCLALSGAFALFFRSRVAEK